MAPALSPRSSPKQGKPCTHIAFKLGEHSNSFREKQDKPCTHIAFKLGEHSNGFRESRTSPVPISRSSWVNIQTASASGKKQHKQPPWSEKITAVFADRLLQRFLFAINPANKETIFTYVFLWLRFPFFIQDLRRKAFFVTPIRSLERAREGASHGEAALSHVFDASFSCFYFQPTRKRFLSLPFALRRERERGILLEKPPSRTLLTLRSPASISNLLESTFCHSYPLFGESARGGFSQRSRPLARC
ncbi:MAG: hypothetical protein PHY12_08330 [Eubacteriales bacterium]|nr:hypothetical protein [Eubacteriales bacterium]